MLLALLTPRRTQPNTNVYQRVILGNIAGSVASSLLPRHSQLPGELHDKRPVLHPGQRAGPPNLVVHEEEPRTGSAQPPEANVPGQVVALVVVLDQRLQKDPRRERLSRSEAEQH